jgi:hypothetical protein
MKTKRVVNMSNYLFVTSIITIALSVLIWKLKKTIPPFVPDPPGFHGDIEVIPASPEESFRNRLLYDI